MEDIIRMNVGK